jgi:proton-translocating NADH-quinone oxidoreductase chain L
MYLLIIFLPLINFLTLFFFGHFIGRLGGIRITLNIMSIGLLCSLLIFYEVGINGSICYLTTGIWFNFQNLFLSWGFLFDTLTAVMLIVVFFISFLVHIYSIEYMETDPHLIRFLAYLSLFTFFMLILVTADNFIQLFIGWEGVGLCSYLLINFWSNRFEANKAALKAMFINKIGDISFLIAVCFIFYNFRSFNFLIINSLIPYFININIIILNTQFNLIFIIGFFLFFAAVGKSAQIFLHIWLPDAMEGPTPVSALIHAATMVTAGVFLILRTTFFFEYNEYLLSLITLFGLFTMCFSGFMGLFQMDIKKIVAYSTASQLGYMIFSCGTSNYTVCFFHLTTHAFFKALLFLAAGAIIHHFYNEQDIRKLSGLIDFLPFTFICLFIGINGLTGSFFFSAFYSKDLIINLGLIHLLITNDFLFWINSLGLLMTFLYSFNLPIQFFEEIGFSSVFLKKKIHESKKYITFVLFTLSLLSIFGGFLFIDFFFGLGSLFFDSVFFDNNLYNFDDLLEDLFFKTTKLFPLIVTICVLSLLSIFYLNENYNLYNKIKKKVFFFIKTNELFNFYINSKLYNFYSNKINYFIIFFELAKKNLFFNFFLQIFIIKNLNFMLFSFKVLDKGYLEIIGPFGLKTICLYISKYINLYQLSSFTNYLFLLFFHILFILIYFLLII